jgi:RES domain-containing protein
LLALYVCIPVRFDGRMVTTLGAQELPADWRREPASASTRQLGDTWVHGRRSPVWRVPSAVVPRESSFLLNPAHPDFGSLKIGEPEPIRFDERLLKRA